MGVARWRWVLVPMIVVVAGCLPRPAVPPGFVTWMDQNGARFTASVPPLGGPSPSDIVRRQRLSGLWLNTDPGPPLYGVVDCVEPSECRREGSRGIVAPGERRAAWLFLYPSDGAAGDAWNWLLVDAVTQETIFGRPGGIDRVRHGTLTAVHDATPPGWYVGRPSYHDERREWAMYAFDQREQAKVGVRSREWTAVGATEVECLLEMAGCLRDLGGGPDAAVTRG